MSYDMMHKINNRQEDRPYQAPAAGEVQVRVRATGLCGSDLHYYNHGRNGDFALQHPMCLGHESAVSSSVQSSNFFPPPTHKPLSMHTSLSRAIGTLKLLAFAHGQGEIVAVGSDVPSDLFAIGDRVAIEAGVYCKACTRCKEGRYNLCASMRFASSAKTHPHLDGTLQRYLNWPYWGVHALPSNVSLESAALIEPLSVVLQGLRRSNLWAGESVLVLGAGAVGLLSCVTAKASGASFVAAVDINEGRLKFARENRWADATYLLPKAPPPASQTNDSTADGDTRARRAAEDSAIIDAAKHSAASMMDSLFPTTPKDQLRDRVRDRKREGFDAIFECSGVPSCVQMGIFAARPGGRIVLIGMGTPIQIVPIGAAALREVDILGVFRYAGTYPIAISMLSGDSLRAQGGGVSADGRTTSKAAGLEVAEGKGAGQRMGGIENIISHRYSLEQAREAFETLTKGKSDDGREATKVFIVH